MNTNTEAAKASFFKGLDCLDKRDFANAENLFIATLELAPRSIPALTNLAIALYEQKKIIDASATAKKTIEIDPRNIDAYLMLLACQKEQEKYEKALATCEAIIGLDSTNAQAHCGRGYVLNKIGKYQEAIESFDRALAIQPEFTDAFLNRGNSLRNLKRYDEAFAAYEKALALQPDLEGAWVGRGNVFLNRNRDTEALECYDTALALKPDSADAKFNKALLKLSLGEYEEGWKLYEWRWKIGNFTSPIRHFPQPLWIGNSDIGGKTILVHAEQGFGDTIQFSRYVNLLKDKQCKIIFEIPKQLSSLFKSPNWQCDVVVQGELIPWFDLHCPLMSLPLAFRTEVETIPATIPYIKAHKDKKIEWAKRVGAASRPRVGLAWSGNPLFARGNDISRPIPLSVLASIINNDFEWYRVQKDLRESDRRTLSNLSAIKDFSDLFNDFSETAALIEELDLVISIDTAVAHLAAAMGKPVWIMLPFHPDFRWLRERTDSPWYPTARLYRQKSDGDWTDVLGRISADLKNIERQSSAR